MLARRSDRIDAPANTTTTLSPLNLTPMLAQDGVALVVLTLDQPNGVRVSQNIYWQGSDEASLQKLNSLPPQNLTVQAHAAPGSAATIVSVNLENRGSVPALAAKLTAVDSEGKRVLPVIYSDNYITLLPHEPRKVDIRCPAGAHCARIQIRGWNVQPTTIAVEGGS
jgi:hypothetical protein